MMSAKNCCESKKGNIVTKTRATVMRGAAQGQSYKARVTVVTLLT
jgi:hypothetical protein